MIRKVMPDVVSDQDIFALTGDATVGEAVRGMAERNIHAVLVIDGEQLTGIFTSTDLVTRVVAVGRRPSLTPLQDVMTRQPQTVNPDFDAGEALRCMHKGGFRHLPVVDNGKVVGMLSRRDFLEYELEVLAQQKRGGETV